MAADCNIGSCCGSSCTAFAVPLKVHPPTPPQLPADLNYTPASWMLYHCLLQALP